jgi:hypothetical protein
LLRSIPLDSSCGKLLLILFRLTRWLSAFIAGWFSLKLLHSKKSSTAFMDAPSLASDGTFTRPKYFAGRTLDLTLFGVTRAFDVIVGELWSQRKARKVATGSWTKVMTPVWSGNTKLINN